MKVVNLLFLLILGLAIYSKADGPLYKNKDVVAQQEFDNVYQDLRTIRNSSSGTVTSLLSSTNTWTAAQNFSSFTANQATITTATIQNINGTFIGLGRNRVINGDMFRDQRNEGAAVTLGSNSNTFGVDRFFGYNRGYPGKWTQQRVSATPPPQFAYDWKITITSATLFVASSETANAEYVVSHRIEGPNWVDSGFASSYAQNVGVSFWVRTSSAGNYGFSLESTSGNPDTYPIHYNIPTANVWTHITATIPGDTGGPWAFGEGQIGLKLIWDLGSGTGFQKTSSAWYGGASQEYNRLTNDNRIVTVLNATWELTGVQVEIGQPTAFEFVPVQMAYEWCRRYYRKSYQTGSVPGAVTSTGRISLAFIQVGASAVRSGVYQFVPQMTTDPGTITLYATDGTQGSWTFTSTGGVSTVRVATTGDAQKDGFFINNATALDFFGFGHFTADAEL